MICFDLPMNSKYSLDILAYGYDQHLLAEALVIRILTFKFSFLKLFC